MESASSNIVQSRNPKIHAVMPLRGKVLNTLDHDLVRVLENKQLKELVLNLGCGIGEDFDISKLRYHKIIILSDADVDGLNIQNLLLTFFITHMSELITGGYVYIGSAPLFEIALGGDKFIYCTTEEEFKKTTAKLKSGYKVSRLKGLGSMTAAGFKETVMNPDRRIISQVVIDDLGETRTILRKLQSDDTTFKVRKSLSPIGDGNKNRIGRLFLSCY